MKKQLLKLSVFLAAIAVVTGCYSPEVDYELWNYQIKPEIQAHYKYSVMDPEEDVFDLINPVFDSDGEIFVEALEHIDDFLENHLEHYRDIPDMLPAVKKYAESIYGTDSDSIFGLYNSMVTEYMTSIAQYIIDEFNSITPITLEEPIYWETVGDMDVYYSYCLEEDAWFRIMMPQDQSSYKYSLELYDL